VTLSWSGGGDLLALLGCQRSRWRKTDERLTLVSRRPYPEENSERSDEGLVPIPPLAGLMRPVAPALSLALAVALPGRLLDWTNGGLAGRRRSRGGRRSADVNVVGGEGARGKGVGRAMPIIED
jgi:hypothetical protein